MISIIDKHDFQFDYPSNFYLFVSDTSGNKECKFYFAQLIEGGNGVHVCHLNFNGLWRTYKIVSNEIVKGLDIFVSNEAKLAIEKVWKLQAFG